MIIEFVATLQAAFQALTHLKVRRRHGVPAPQILGLGDLGFQTLAL